MPINLPKLTLSVEAACAVPVWGGPAVFYVHEVRCQRNAN